MLDRGVYGAQVRDAIPPSREEVPAGLHEGRKSRHIGSVNLGSRSQTSFADERGFRRGGETRSSSRPALPGGTDSPRSSAGGKDKLGQKSHKDERRQEEMFSKWAKTEAVRQRDLQNIAERVERAKELREARFKGLLASVSGEDEDLAGATDVDLRERGAREEQRRRKLYDEWDEKLYQPMLAQVHRHLNPPDRAIEQLFAGSKTVAWNLPGAEFKLMAKVHEDPSRRSLVEHARENAFHQAAESVLKHSHSAPNLGTLKTALTGVDAVPRARSKPVLDPTEWSETRIQGTLHGHFAQVVEPGVTLKRIVRGGPHVHVPDESDGVPAAGTRVSRAFGYHDKGILVGDCASRGQSAQYKQAHGVSCGAPAQDHYSFETGAEVTDLEFPLGRRVPQANAFR